MRLGTELGDEIGRYLDLSTRQIQLTAANMANIDTPGYRAVGMDFEAEMHRVLAAVAAGEDSAFKPRVFAVDGLVVRPDGNDVSMDRESLNLAAAQLKFKTGVALLKLESAEMTDAIHADAK
jgi:flagellar basal-body rod protein FlgB